MRRLRNIRRSASAALLAALPAAALVAAAPGAQAAQAPLVLGAPYGEHDGLTAARAAYGMTALAWRATSGEGRTVRFAAIAPGGREALPVETVAGVRMKRLSTPRLAVSPSGRVAIAWFEERETYDENEVPVAVKVRERAADGTWGPIATVWRTAPKQRYRREDLAVALDDGGDLAVIWEAEPASRPPRPGGLLVATRSEGGAFTAPATLDPRASETPPTVAVAPGGQVSALWVSPWRSGSQSLNARSWSAGAAPAGAVSTLDTIAGPGSALHDSLSGLTLETSPSGVQLAAWLRGVKGDPQRPNLVALRAAWRLAPAPFEASQTVTPPGVEARSVSLDLAADGRAVLGWSEITPEGGLPVLAYASAAPGKPLVAAVTQDIKLTSDVFASPGVSAVWLPGARELFGWESGSQQLTGETASGGGPIHVAPVRALAGELSETEDRGVFAGGETGPPVLAWIGRSPSDFAGKAVRYLVGAGLPAFPPAPGPTAMLTGSHALATAGVSVAIGCVQACTVSARGTAFALRGEDAENAAAGAWAALGALTTGATSLPAGGSSAILLKLTPATRHRFCVTARRGDDEAAEVLVTVQEQGAERRYALGEEPSLRGCRRR